MTMEQVGYVVASQNGQVKVRVMRESACGGNCVSCKGCPSDSVFISCMDDKDSPYQIGEEVLITMPAKHFLNGTFGSYGLMTACTLAGGILGYILSKIEPISVLGAVVGLILGASLMRLLFRNYTSGIQIARRKE